jgi:iron(III) transport system ATP-binding protein
MSLEIKHLQFRYKKNQPLIENLSLSIPSGKVTAIVGSSGCGKTTLISLILGLLKPQLGTIEVFGQIFNDSKTFTATEFRKVGVVFQDYALFPHLTVNENITFGMSKKHKQDKKKLIDLLKLFDVANISYYYPHQLSGGQMQRVALARAMAMEPTLLLLDEPFSNLDSVLKVRLREEMLTIIHTLNMTTMIVTHDKEDAQFMAENTLDLNTLMQGFSKK